MTKRWIAVGVVVVAVSAQAQTPEKTILGVGSMVFDVEVPPAQAQAQAYKVYVPDTSTTPLTVPVTCIARTPSGSTCTFSTALLLPLVVAGTARTIAVTASVSADDGARESPKAPAPFVLRRADAPVTPVAPAIRP